MLEISKHNYKWKSITDLGYREMRRSAVHRLGGVGVEIARDRQTFTALNHVARRLARRERNQGGPEAARSMTARPDWQNGLYVPGRRGRRRLKRQRSKFPPPRSVKAPGELPTWMKR